MKQKTTLILSLAILCLGVFAFTKGAPKSKIGHIHTNALWEIMPEKKKADTTLAMQRIKLESFFKEKQTEFQNKYMAYTKDSASLTGAIKEQRLKEVVDLNKTLQELPKSFDEDLNKSRETLYAPIRKKMQNAVDKVSAEFGFDFIFDSSYGTIIYAKNDADNIMPLVKKELKIK